jgi:hypothetical protein
MQFGAACSPLSLLPGRHGGPTKQVRYVLQIRRLLNRLCTFRQSVPSTAESERVIYRVRANDELSVLLAVREQAQFRAMKKTRELLCLESPHGC